MGSNFFKAHGGVSAPKLGGIPGSNLFARSISAPGYAARGFSSSSGKDLGMASAIEKAGGLHKTTGSAAYAPGPKRT